METVSQNVFFSGRVSVAHSLLHLTAALLALRCLSPVMVVIAPRDQLSCVSPNVPKGSMKPEQPRCLETVGSCRAHIELRLLLVRLKGFFFSPALFRASGLLTPAAPLPV